jgi:hypothetical protein
MTHEARETETSDDKAQPSDLREHIDEAKDRAGIDSDLGDAEKRPPQPGVTPPPEPDRH